MLNGVTQIVLTKLDVLNTFETIKVCEQYRTNKGITSRMPFDLHEVAVQPEYTSKKGWNCPTQHIRDYRDLSSETKDYIKYIEDQLNIPIKIISVGPEREELVQHSIS